MKFQSRYKGHKKIRYVTRHIQLDANRMSLQQWVQYIHDDDNESNNIKPLYEDIDESHKTIHLIT